MPPLLARHPQDAVADVVVVAEHVGELVVDVVVAVLPLLGRLRGVPLPRRGVDLRVVHPVPLAVHDVVADLHVLQDLGDPEHGGARDPRRLPARREQRDPARHREAALDGDDAVDVRRVGGAAGLLDLGAQRVELAPELVDLLVGEVGVLLDVADGHGGSFRGRARRSDGEGAVADRRRSRRSAPGRGLSSYSSPVRRSRTVPLTSVSVQVWQMPTRQP